LVRDAPHPESFSFSIWINSNKPGEQNPIFSRENKFFPSNGAYYSLFNDGEGALHWMIAANETIVTEPGLITDGENHHIVVTHLDTDGPDTFQADRARLYIDGVMVGETENPTEVPSLDSIADAGEIFRNIWLGTLSGGPGYKGEMDDFQYYSTELTEEQIAGMFANPGTIASFSPEPLFEVTEISAVPHPEAGTDVTITWTSKPTRNYSIETWSTALGGWVEEIDSIEGAEGSATTTHILTQVAASQNIYRILAYENGE
jgi:hypothetical protein